jgi:putative protease
VFSSHQIELLSPAGDWDSLRAACSNGADAVYFGLFAFNARHRAANFAPEELPKVIDFLHARNVKGFVTLNTLIFSDELDEVARYVNLVAMAAADAVIVQDMGLARLIAKMAPDLHVHASTQMTLTEPRGVEWARDRLARFYLASCPSPTYGKSRNVRPSRSRCSFTARSVLPTPVNA